MYDCDTMIKKYVKGDKPMLRNPYTPGAGNIPSYLAGRETLLQNITEQLNELNEGGIAIHTIYYGVRGVGKTVLLNKIEEMVDNLGFLYTHIEGDSDTSFIKYIVLFCKQFIKRLSFVEGIKDALNQLKATVFSFQTTYSVEDNAFTWGLNEETLIQYGDADTGDLTYDLTTLFCSLGKLAKRCQRPICFIIDEIQNFSKENLSALITAIHRTNQLGYPVLVIGAGLPTILRLCGDAKSYSERLFSFVEITSLKREAAIDALVIPASQYNVKIEQLGVEYVLDKTGNYPYFIQEYGRIIWKYMDDSRYISLDSIITAYSEYIEKLDAGFFGVRYNRSTAAEKRLLFAMAKSNSFPCAMSTVATILGKSTKSISPLRNNLINKGLLYAPSFGEIDFTVPKFNEYLERVNPNLEID